MGRNYAEHRKEMGGSDREEPFFFQKPHDAVFHSSKVHYPMGTSQFSYEAELVVVIGPSDSVYGYAVGVDFTKRDIQAEAKKLGRPWEASKAFDRSGLVGEIVEAAVLGSVPHEAVLSFTLNGQINQSAQISQMIWSVPELIENLRESDLSVKQGDLIFTGTPAGVGTLSVGDKCAVALSVNDTPVVPQLEFVVTDRQYMTRHMLTL